MPKRLAARSSILECIHFCIWNGFSWIDAVSLLRSFPLDDLLQNGTFKSEFGIRNRRFGWNTWTCLLYLSQSSLLVMTWYHIGKHYFSLSEDWGIWPLLALYNMVSIFIYWAEYGHCIGRGIWPLLISSSVVPIFIYWAESGHCFTIGTFGFHRVHL